MRQLLWVICGCLLWFTAASARADNPACASNARACLGVDADWAYNESAFDGVDLDSGWMPEGADIQIRLGLMISGETNVTLGGHPTVQWPDGIEFSVPGRPRTGVLQFDYGMTIIARLRINIEIEGESISWEGNIPIPRVPNDLACSATVNFEPMMLDGASGRPVTGSDDTGLFNFINFPLTSEIIPISSFIVSGGFGLTLQAGLETTYQTDRFVVSDAAPITTENMTTLVSPSNGDTNFGAMKTIIAHPEGTLTYNTTLYVIPNIYISILTHHFPLNLAMIPFNIDNHTTNAVFPDQSFDVPLPDVAVSVASIDFGTVDNGSTNVRPVVITNNGLADLTIVSYGPSAPFSMSNDPITITPGAEQTLLISFAPTSDGISADSIVFETNDPDSPLLTLNLSGAAVEPDGGVDEFPGDGGPYDRADFGLDDAGVGGKKIRGGCCSVAGRSNGTSDRAGWLTLCASVAIAVTRRRKQSRR